ncbi:acyl-CoA synthetase [Spirosoma pollinicola]|uniref:Long-chain fatty acid--CoA ligase n=1 Tax=Spirosoma pollinicola TaxID=2057025 RepID=A0A2K8YY64_9BACT|nr:acyl-CoA synthetase [Spirosoma pollinicola]AUD02565.1 long-chain fatty acid--CoA ligase [Spirosoma pollinicola]
MLSLLRRQPIKPAKTAIVANNRSYSYHDLQEASHQFASILLEDRADLLEARVAFMVLPGFDYVRTQWGIWLAGGIAVPLCITYPLASLQYVIEDTQAEIIVVSPEFEPVLKAYSELNNIRFIVVGESQTQLASVLPKLEPTRRAMILYTSGTTNLPKGVVTTHANIEAQVSTLVYAWAYSDQDTILCVLPLHHVHGIINVISCTLWAGGTVEFLPNFSAERVFDWFTKTALQPVSGLFMAVPTIYFKLIAYFDSLPDEQQKALKASMTTFRLMVSGSAALPVSVMEKWETISGHRLLERYGMTEIGMAISNPYLGERRAGHIGQALPGVTIRLVDEQNQEVAPGDAGEIQVKGANVFQEYWRKPDATEATFTADGWFKTGDVAVQDDGYYKILGRSSIDIIKSGGYKISALEIEEVLRTHPQISDCSVVGVDNEEWGELVVAALVVNDTALDTSLLNAWIRELMPAYKVPRQYLIVDDLPRNAMGKVTKNDLKKLF